MRRTGIILLGAALAFGLANADATACGQDGGRLKVGVYADEGASGIGAIEWFRLVHDSPEMELKLLDGEIVRAGGLDGLDVLVMPGGDSKLQFTSLGPDGISRMKKFVASGGGYIGTCGGCYLLLDRTGGSHKRAHMVPWDKSGAEPSLLYPTFNLNEKGAAALGMEPGEYKVSYHAGPILVPSTNAVPDAKVEVWATYASDFDCPKSKLQMFGNIALVGGTYGKGRLFAIACHPEANVFSLGLVKGAFRFVLGREVTFPTRIRRPRSLVVGAFSSGIGGVVEERCMCVEAQGRPNVERMQVIMRT